MSIFGADIRLVLGGLGALIFLYVLAKPQNTGAIQTAISDVTKGVAVTISNLQGK